MGESVMDVVKLDLPTGTVTLARVKDEAGTWLGTKECHTKLMETIPRQTYNNNIRYSGAQVRKATLAENNFLYQSKAIRTRAKFVSLVDAKGFSSVAANMLPWTDLSETILGLPKLPAFKGEPMRETAPPPPPPDPSTYVVPHRGPPPPPPIELPVCIVPATMFHVNFGLSEELIETEPLRSELIDLRAWCVAGRPGQGYSNRSWENLSKGILVYLGFCRQFLKIPRLTLETLLEAEPYSHFFSFQLEKKNATTTCTQHVSNFKKALSYLGREGQGEAVQTAQELQDWLVRLAKQISQLPPRTRAGPEQLEQVNSGLGVTQIFKALTQLRDVAKQGIPAQGLCMPVAARLLHDAALTGLIFGMKPPVKLSCIWTLQLPDSGPACLQTSCHHEGCLGNRLELGPGDSLSLMLTHYKKQGKGQQRFIRVQLPQDLADLLRHFLERGHSVTCKDSQLVFTNRHARPFDKPSKLNQYWNGILRGLGCKGVVPLYRLRKIFAEGREGDLAAAGTSEAGAAAGGGGSSVASGEVGLQLLARAVAEEGDDSSEGDDDLEVEIESSDEEM